MNGLLKDKKILFGITGGIAAYKAPEMIRQLIKEGAEVRTIMTDAGSRFVSPLALETVTGHECMRALFPEKGFYATHHIDWADWADVLVIAPATANFLAKYASGIADDVLTTVNLAFTKQRVIAPAMNVHMWEHAATQRNLRQIQEYGDIICPPDSGYLACGYSGSGRLAPYHHIRQYILKSLFPDQPMRGKKVCVNLGPTREFIDPVRYISNFSSGKMGYNLALLAFANGAEVTVIAGPVDLPQPAEMQWLSVTSAKEMAELSLDVFSDQCDIFIGSAAISDFTLAEKSRDKIKRGSQGLSLDLDPTIDVIATIGKQKKKHQKVIGFALESQDVINYGISKLKKKNLDAIVINSALQSEGGMGRDKNEVTVVDAHNQSIQFPSAPKEIIAAQIWDFLIQKVLFT